MSQTKKTLLPYLENPKNIQLPQLSKSFPKSSSNIIKPASRSLNYAYKQIKSISDRIRDYNSQNLSLVTNLERISRNKHKDSIQNKMKPNPEFINRHCNASKDFYLKCWNILPSNEMKKRLLLRDKSHHDSKTLIEVKRVVATENIKLPDISYIDPKSHNRSESINPRRVSKDQRAVSVPPIRKEQRKILCTIQGEYYHTSECYFDQKKNIFLGMNQKIRGRIFFVELAKQDGNEDLYVFGRDVMTMNLYMLRLHHPMIEKIFNKRLINYEKVVRNLDFHNKKLVLELEPVGNILDTSDLDDVNPQKSAKKKVDGDPEPKKIEKKEIKVEKKIDKGNESDDYADDFEDS